MSGSHKPRRGWRHRVCTPHPCNTVRHFAFEIEAPDTAQFECQARGHYTKPLADQPRVAALQIERRLDADRF
jgi:hypothetical protein